MLALAYSGCDYTWAVVWLSAAVAMNGSVSTGPLASMVDISPNYASVILGIVNSIVALVGFLTPAVVGQLTYQNVTAIPTLSRHIFTIKSAANGATMAESLLDIDRHVGQHRRPLRRLRKIRTPALEHSRRPHQRFRIDLDEEKQRQRRRQERHTHKTIKTTPCPTTIGQNTVQSPVLIEINSIVRMPTPPRLVIGPCFCLVPRPLRKQVGFDG
jgi:hypothetical protein